MTGEAMNTPLSGNSMMQKSRKAINQAGRRQGHGENPIRFALWITHWVPQANLNEDFRLARRAFAVV
jgi:hypothetical protein